MRDDEIRRMMAEMAALRREVADLRLRSTPGPRVPSQPPAVRAFANVGQEQVGSTFFWTYKIRAFYMDGRGNAEVVPYGPEYDAYNAYELGNTSSLTGIQSFVRLGGMLLGQPGATGIEPVQSKIVLCVRVPIKLDQTTVEDGEWMIILPNDITGCDTST